MPTTSGVMVRVKPNGAWRFHGSNANFTVSNYGANANLEIRIVSDFLTLTTLGGSDTTPNAFTFTAANNVALSTATISNSVTIAGIDTPSPISISGGSGAYSISNGAFTSTSGTISNNQTVRVRVTSSNTANTAVSTTLTIGGVTSTFTVRTAPPVGWSVTAGNNSVTVTSAPTPAVPTATAGNGTVVVN